jgi:hypothetical protein
LYWCSKEVGAYVFTDNPTYIYTGYKISKVEEQAKQGRHEKQEGSWTVRYPSTKSHYRVHNSLPNRAVAESNLYRDLSWFPPGKVTASISNSFHLLSNSLIYFTTLPADRLHNVEYRTTVEIWTRKNSDWSERFLIDVPAQNLSGRAEETQESE